MTGAGCAAPPVPGKALVHEHTVVTYVMVAYAQLWPRFIFRVLVVHGYLVI
jgi:hypothetical protein